MEEERKKEMGDRIQKFKDELIEREGGRDGPRCPHDRYPTIGDCYENAREALIDNFDKTEEGYQFLSVLKEDEPEIWELEKQEFIKIAIKLL